MGIYFGTDGIRGIVNKSLTYNLAFKCGNTLASSKPRTKIVIGGDTRTSRNYITSAFASGAMSAGAEIIDIGICTTPGIAHITKSTNADFGVVVSASHNPPEYNGIKIFNCNGIKLGDKEEEDLERKFIYEITSDYLNIGTFCSDEKLVKIYEDYLASCCNAPLNNLKILIDCSNGASYKIAPRVFRKLGAKVTTINCTNSGENINNNCGSTHPRSLMDGMKKYKADIGFAYDGDADRLIACDEKGNIIDGDILIFVLAKYLKSLNILAKNTVVGTTHTNKGLEEDLQTAGIQLLRANIGDKYVIEKMNECNLNLGGEKSGHIILNDYISTGDGILASIKISEILARTKKKFSTLCKVHLYPQCNIDCIVSDKVKILNHFRLIDAIEHIKAKLGEDGRLLVRASGTEEKIRIMVETKSQKLSKKYAKAIEKIVMELEKSNAKNVGENQCAE